MSISYKQFLTELYQDHVEEAAAFYDQRLLRIEDDVADWMVPSFDDTRLEAHLDALVIGGTLGLGLTKDAALEAEPGAVYVLVNLYCRYQQLDALLDFIEAMDLEEESVRQAMAVALMDQFPDAWVTPVQDLFQQPLKAPNICALFVPVLLKKQQFPKGIAFEPLLQPSSEQSLMDPISFIEAAGVMRDKNSRNVLASIVVQGKAKVKHAALIALLRIGFHQIIGYTLHNVPADEQPTAVIMLGAPLDLFNAQANIAQSDWTPSTIFQLMIGGVADYIPQLISALANEALAPAVAEALFVITGERLTASLFVEEEWEEDDLFADELAAFKEGKVPQRSDGMPYGVEVEELVIDHDAWMAWWQENQGRFVSGKRYRLGRLVSPVSLVKALTHPFLKESVRRACYLEMVIRYNAVGHFSEVDLVRCQQRFLRELYQWAEQVESSCVPGDWYFSGAIQPASLTQ
jgi:hypothetical protein